MEGLEGRTELHTAVDLSKRYHNHEEMLKPAN